MPYPRDCGASVGGLAHKPPTRYLCGSDFSNIIALTLRQELGTTP